MNRSDLTTAISEKTGLSASQAQAALDATTEAIVSAVAAGDKVTLPGFGTFEARERAARTGRNPQTGATLEIAAGRSPAFKPGTQFKDRVRA